MHDVLSTTRVRSFDLGPFVTEGTHRSTPPQTLWLAIAGSIALWSTIIGGLWLIL
jgi:hypothetical protein